MRRSVGVLLVVACGSGRAEWTWKGFAEQEVTVRESSFRLLEDCRARTGRLVLEVERTIINEYPNFGSRPREGGQRPALIVSLETPGLGHQGSQAGVWIAPSGHQPGQAVVYLAGRRVLDSPIRHLAGKHLTLRLVETDSLAPPEWVESLRHLQPVGSAAANLGLSLPIGVVADASWLLLQLDPDDLVMLWRVELDAVIARLVASSEPVALGLDAVTPRKVAGDSQPGRPVAEMRLLAYREPEPGCP